MCLVILAGTLVAGTLGGAGTFISVLACTASGLHSACVQCGCALGMVHWVAADLGCGAAASA